MTRTFFVLLVFAMSGIRNLNAIRRMLTGEIPKLIEQAAQEAISDTMLEGQRLIKKDLNERGIWITGNLSRSILVDRSQLKSLKGRIYATADYAPHVEYGHVIVRGGRVVGHAEGKRFMEKAREQLPNILHKNVARSLGRRL